MPFLHDLRITWAASAEIPCFVMDSPITCMQLISVCSLAGAVEWACWEDTVSLLLQVTVVACSPTGASALDTMVGSPKLGQS